MPQGTRRGTPREPVASGRGSRRSTSRATPLATRAPVAATPVTVRTAPPTGSPPREAGFGRALLFGRWLVFAPAAGFAAFDPLRSARAAAFAAVFSVRFSLRWPGRERGRFPSTPPSSAIVGESSPPRIG